jgi:hypothetical protein
VAKACLLQMTLFCLLSSNNQILSLESTGVENVTQLFTISTNSTYLLQFQWLPPQTNSLSGKSVTIMLNNIPIDTISINLTNFLNLFISNYSITISISAGVNELKFAMNGPSDGSGIFIENVFLQEIINQSANSTQNATNSTQNATNSTQNITNSTLNISNTSSL